MLLNQLSHEEKTAYISLSIHVANSNGVFAEEEKAMIQEYCKEMDLPLFDVYHVKSMEEIVETFAESEQHSKKIVLLELLGLVYSDGFYDDTEKKFIDDFAGKIGLTEKIVEQQTAVIKEYLDVLKRIEAIVK